MKTGLLSLLSGILIFLLGIVGIPAWVILHFLLAPSLDSQFLVPGRIEVRIEEPGRYYLWNDFQTVFNGTTFSASEVLPTGYVIRIVGPDGGELPFIADTSISSSIGSSSKNSIGYVNVNAPAKLAVEVGGAVPPRVFSFARFTLFGTLATVAAALGGIAILCLAGLALAVFGIVRIVRARKTAA